MRAVDQWWWDAVGVLAICDCSRANTPLGRLRLAVLRQALRVVMNPTRRLRSLGGRLYSVEWTAGELEAEQEWFLSDDVDYPLSFRAVCLGLGIDADYLRAGLIGRGFLNPIDRDWLERERVAMRSAQAAAHCRRGAKGAAAAA
jgi:hypothetical protein